MKNNTRFWSSSTAIHLMLVAPLPVVVYLRLIVYPARTIAGLTSTAVWILGTYIGCATAHVVLTHWTTCMSRVARTRKLIVTLLSCPLVIYVVYAATMPFSNVQSYSDLPMFLFMLVFAWFCALSLPGVLDHYWEAGKAYATNA